MRWYEVRNLWVNTEAAFHPIESKRDKRRYDSVGYYTSTDVQNDSTWVEVARFPGGDSSADDDANRRNRDEERHAQIAEHGVALFVETADGETIVGLKDAIGACVSCFPFDGAAIEHMGVQYRVLHHRSERAIVFDALLARYRAIGMEYHA